MTTASTPVEEGPRSFAHFFEQLADGDAHREAASELHSLTKKLLEEARSRGEAIGGTLTLTLKLVADPKGHFAVGYDLTKKEPKPRRSGDVFFSTRGGNLTKQNEKQQQLKLQDVSAPRGAVVDVNTKPVLPTGELVDPETGEVFEAPPAGAAF